MANLSRRVLLKSSFLGMITASIPNIIFARNISEVDSDKNVPENLFHRYPSIDDEIVAEVVGASHFNFERVQELVNKRPELARATWDWSFGDWETALGAASHVGRRDIAEFLISKGARPDIFTYAMLGHYEAVKAMIEAQPGVESIWGPHGITLLQHAQAGLRSDSSSEKQKDESKKLIDYLEGLGTANLRPENLEMSIEDKEKYLGDYRYGDGPNEGLTVKVNMRKMLSLGKLGKAGGGLYQKSPNVFTYNGVSSVEISFKVENGKVLSLTVTEPGLVLTAKKV
ncbi:MAG: hypothetical protein R3A50_13840 [Saprospiraceae bacterium]